MSEGLVKTCASRLLPVSGTRTLLATGNLHSLVTVSGRRGIRQRNREESSGAITNQDSSNLA
jgi:hypothetical protein